MKIIFDCGSTKTSVAIISSDSPTLHLDLANGYNALTGGDDELRTLISSHPAMDPSRIPARQIHYYGAGCATPQACHRVGSQLAGIFPQAEIHINSDMLGAARAVCGDSLYDGKEITANVSPLGYILGDEGSGAVLGRRFLGLLLKNQFPTHLKQLFEVRFHLDIPDIITRVYRTPRPNAFLASFAPFIAENAHIPEISTFLYNEFSRYVTYNLMNYTAFPELPVHLVGSIALHFRHHIEKAVNDKGGHIGNITATPIIGLTTYHSMT